jgi:ribosomal protein L3 glutamine methyltransferase
MLLLSWNEKRNRHYHSFLRIAKTSFVTVDDMIRFGISMMASVDLNYSHSYGSAEEDSEYLAFYTLRLPNDFDREIFRKTKVSRQEVRMFLRLLEKRISTHAPLAYIIHGSMYLDWWFYVNKHTLVPRSLMNHKFKDFLQETEWENFRVLDLCTGSGCIGISLALMDPRISVDLVDISRKALKVAKTNIKMHRLQERVTAIHSNLFANATGKYDLIITNPPYVPTDEYNWCGTEWKREPKLALDAGSRGMDLVKNIITEGWKHLNANGTMIAEIGWSTQTYCVEDFPEVPFEWLYTGYEDGMGRSGVFRLKQGYQSYLPNKG